MKLVKVEIDGEVFWLTPSQAKKLAEELAGYKVRNTDIQRIWSAEQLLDQLNPDVSNPMTAHIPRKSGFHWELAQFLAECTRLYVTELRDLGASIKRDRSS